MDRMPTLIIAGPTIPASNWGSGRRLCRAALAVLVVLGVAPSPSRAQFVLEREPIHYLRGPHDDPAAALATRLAAANKQLAHDPRHGYLAGVLRELGISKESQTLVFSKTSLQKSHIGPRRPRAIYFNDDSYVGWVQDGEVLEIVSIAPRVGPVFYTLRQAKTDRPQLVRQSDDCLQCHASALTQGAPGLLVRSVFPGVSGSPILSAGSFHTTHHSPLAERWGGWYVTGSHGRQRHMGNAVLRGTEDPEKLDRHSGANLTDLAKRFDVRPYLSPHSDLVALMVLEHQATVHNQITLAGYQAMLAQRDQEVLNAMSGKPASTPIESIDRRFDAAAEDLLNCLLLVGEAPLTDRIRGTSGFADHFASIGPRDKRGRSLREFDLGRRLFKHPCSYLIDSKAFDALPAPVRERTLTRLWAILNGAAEASEFPHLSQDDRQAIREILVQTKTNLPACWRREPPVR